jgi:hypothetical protein
MPLPRPLSKAAIEAKPILSPDGATKRDIINRFTNVLYDLTRRGFAVRIGHGPGARWTLASRDGGL